MSMPQHIKDFKEALESGKDMDFIKSHGHEFTKDELINICAELFFSAYQDVADYKGFIRRFMDNMNEYESDYFKEEAYE